MTIYDSIVDDKLERFLMSAPSCKLAVVKATGSNEEKALNLGKELALAISKLDRGNSLSFEFAVGEELERLVKKYTYRDDVFGPVIILSNPGILFENALHINVTSWLKRISKNTLVILLWPGCITEEKLCFLSESSDIHVKQSDINYTII